MVRSRLSLLLAGAAVLAVFATVPAPAAALVSCGDTVTSDVTLTAADPIVNGVCNGNGIVLGDAVTLDCAGFKLRGGGKGAGISVSGGIEGVFILNCAVEGFGNGVVLGGLGFHGMERTVVVGAKNEGVKIDSSDNFVSTTTVLGSQVGFKVSGSFNEVSDSIALNNRKEGFKITGREHFIFNNVSGQNGGSGFDGSTTLTDFSSNTAAGNRGTGIDFNGGKGDRASFLSDNRALANTGDGMVATGSDDGGNVGLGNGGAIACQINGAVCSEF
jgi:hypothetical protein